MGRRAVSGAWHGLTNTEWRLDVLGLEYLGIFDRVACRIDLALRGKPQDRPCEQPAR